MIMTLKDLTITERRSALAEIGWVPCELKKLAGSKTRSLNPMEFYYQGEAQRKGPLEMPQGRNWSTVLFYPPGAKMGAVELGGDIEHPALHPNININPGPGVDIVADLNSGIPLEANTVG